MEYLISKEFKEYIRKKLKCPHSNNGLLCEHCRFDSETFLKHYKYGKFDT